MTCREVGEALLTGAHGDLPTEVQEHLASCENCRKVAIVIMRDRDRYELPPSMLERVRGSIPSSFAPVQPLAPAGLFVTLFLLIFAGIAIGGAERLGISGWPILSPAIDTICSLV